MSDWGEILTDLDAALQQALSGRLWGSYVHSGFYKTMFTTYDAISRLPFGSHSIHRKATSFLV